VDKTRTAGVVDFTVKVSYLEIYQEKLIDLLAGESSQGELKIRQESDGSGLYVQGITERSVGDLKDIMTVHTIGSKNRTTGYACI
jgi:kinesin family protein 4/21/27